MDRLPDAESYEGASHPGDHLVRELQWIHDILRHDLEVCRRLANDAADGKSAQGIQQEINRLQTLSPLWQLKANCLYYCRLVHLHHTGEDIHIFPAVRRSNPALSEVVDKLEADHRSVSALLDEVEVASVDLQKDESPKSRQRLIGALNRLANELLAHLDFEEESLSPTLRSWHHWPTFSERL